MAKKESVGLFAIKRIIRMATLLIAICILTFSLMEASPVDPIRAYVGADLSVSPEQKLKIAEHWGLNDPPLERFVNWAGSFLKGDFGTSLIYRRPVLEVVGERFAASLVLMTIAWIVSGILGFFLGIVSGMKEGKLVDKIIKGYCYVLISTPTFWIGLLLLMIFSVWLGWFPIGLGVPIGVLAEEVTTISLIKHMILPAITLSILGVANIAMHTREKVIEILSQDYVLFAKARGESTKSIVVNHVLRNVALPAITIQFLSFSELFAGTIFAEQVFSYPGLGQTTVNAGLKGDVPLLMGIVIISTIFVFTGNLIADLLYRIIDPRIKEGGRYD